MLAAAPSSAEDDPDWPGGWVLVNEQGQQVSGAGLTTAWRTQQAAEAAAARLATPVRATWAAVSDWADFVVLDRRYWAQADAAAGGQA